MNSPIITNIHTLEWNGQNDCIFTAEITNNMVSALHFCEPPIDGQTCLKSINELYLRQTAANLNELFAYIDKQRSLTGTFRVDEIVELVGE